jgi:exopolyphosphatase/pppGpp-phosphohydrolase
VVVYDLPYMRVAALDIGTNTVLLLIADVNGESFQVLRDDHAIARLGEGVDRTHRISEEAYERFISIIREHQKRIVEFKCDRVIAAATSAMRDAENRDEIIERTRRDTGIDIEILSGDEEARLTYRGAVVGMTPPQPSPSQGEGVIVVLDIGGGSTEISIGTGDAFESGVSLEIGAVRITERFFAMTPIKQDTMKEARQIIREALNHPPAPSYSATLHRRGSFKVASLEITSNSRSVFELKEEDFPFAIIIGNEITGVSDAAIALSDFTIEIPMLGAKHSLNVAVAFGVAAFECVRVAASLPIGSNG